MGIFLAVVLSMFIGMFVVVSTATTEIKQQTITESNKVCETNGGVQSIKSFVKSHNTETSCVNGAKFVMESNK